MSIESEKKGPRNPILPAGAVLVLIGLCVWWFTRTPERIPEPVVEKAPVEAPRPAPPKPALSTLRFAEEPKDDLPIHPVGSAPVPDGAMMHPHPITPQHERIFNENRLIAQLNGAMDVKDAKGMRRLLAEYREGYPEDENVMQDGYQLIIDCLESPGEATRAAAKKYWETELASGLRRYIRRHCLED